MPCKIGQISFCIIPTPLEKKAIFEEKKKRWTINEIKPYGYILFPQKKRHSFGRLDLYTYCISKIDLRSYLASYERYNFVQK